MTVVGAIAPGIVASIYLIHTYGIDTILEFLAGAMLKLGDLIMTGLEIAGSIIKGITNANGDFFIIAGEIILTLVGALVENLPQILATGVWCRII